MKQKDYFTTTLVIFALIAILHLLRILNGWDAEIGGLVIPLWVSWTAVFVAGYLFFSAYRLSVNR